MSQCWTKPYYHIPSLGYNVYILIIYYIVLYPICVYPIQLYPYYITIYIIVVCVCPILSPLSPYCYTPWSVHDDHVRWLQALPTMRPSQTRPPKVACLVMCRWRLQGINPKTWTWSWEYIYIYHILIIVMYNSDHILYIYTWIKPNSEDVINEY